MVIQHDFRVWAELPKEANEGIPVSGKICIQNRSKEQSPSFQCQVIFVWSAVPTKVIMDITVPGLSPDSPPHEVDYSQEPLTGGWMGMMLNSPIFKKDVHEIIFHKQNGENLGLNVWFSSIRAKSIEEQLQEMLIKSLIDSTQSQDNLAEIQNRLATYTLWLTIVQVFLGCVAAYLAWLAIT